MKIKGMTWIAIVGAGVAILYLTKKVSGSSWPKFSVGQQIVHKDPLPTDIIYVIVAVHIVEKMYDIAQIYDGQQMATQYGFDGLTIDASYVLVS